LRRDLFSDEHDLFRDQVRRFVEREVEPRVPEWNEKGMSDRETWRRAGEAGLLGACAPEEYGGAGADFLYDAIVIEEFARVRAHALMMSLHSDICMPYLTTYASEEQKQRYLPGAIRGEILLGICMTEPGTGSDLAAVETKAIRDGDHYVLSGAKTFISNGQIGDLFIVVAKTDPGADPPHRGISLILVEAETPGFVRGRKLDKLGLVGQDTSEIFFEDCRVPARTGHQRDLLRGLPRARTQPPGRGGARLLHADGEAAAGAALHRRLLHRLLPPGPGGYPRLREGAPSLRAAHRTVPEHAVQAGRARHPGRAGSGLRRPPAGRPRAWRRRRLGGDGYGFMREYPISMDYADAAVQSIYAGTNEIMKVIIARRLGL
jgi:acyl-CoA dehydrogenase